MRCWDNYAMTNSTTPTPTTTLTITGMRDEHCLRLVTNAIQDLPGIGHLEIALDTGAATIEHGSFVSEADIHHAIEDAGFGVR